MTFFAQKQKNTYLCYSPLTCLHCIHKLSTNFFKMQKMPKKTVGLRLENRNVPLLEEAERLFFSKLFLYLCTMRKHILSLLLFSLFVLVGKAQTGGISQEIFEDIMKHLPSPMEISFLLKDLDVKHDKNLLTPISYVQKAETPFQQTFLLGVLSTDIGYNHIYGKPEALETVEACQKINQKLRIDSVVNFKKLQTMVKAKEGLDTLLIEYTIELEHISQVLHDKGRAELVVAMLVGGWLKSLHLTCEGYAQQRAELLKMRVGEQKIVLEQVILLLSFYENKDAYTRNIMQGLQSLSKIYESVDIIIKQTPSVQKEINGQIVIEGGTTQQVDIDNKTLRQIHQKTKEILANTLEGK